MKNKPEYRAEVCKYNGEQVLCIWDLCGAGMSVTNGAEIVLAELAETLDVVPEVIIYQDSEGIWDRMVWDGTMVTFMPLRERNGNIAASLAVEQVKQTQITRSHQ